MGKRNGHSWRVAVEFIDSTCDLYGYRTYEAAWLAYRGVLQSMRQDPRGFGDVQLIDPLGNVLLASDVSEPPWPYPHPLAPGSYVFGEVNEATGAYSVTRVGESRPL